MTEPSALSIPDRRSGPSPHLSWMELACWNRLRDAEGRPRPFNGVPPGELVAVYPLDLRRTLGPRLGVLHETIRAAVWHLVGREVPLIVNSAYRSPEYDRAVGGVSGWHVRGGALDLRTPSPLTTEEFHALILGLSTGPLRSVLGGLGRYQALGFCHVDIRPRPSDGHGGSRLARWDG